MTSPTELPVSADELKPGERVRVTLEGEFELYGADDKDLWLRDETGRLRLVGASFAALTITRLPKPLEVGDRVRFNGWDGTIKAIAEGHALILWDVDTWGGLALSSLTRIEQES